MGLLKISVHSFWVQLLFGKLGKRLFDVYKVVNKRGAKIKQCNNRREQVNVYFFYFKSLEDFGCCACKYRNEEGYKTNQNCEEQTNGNNLCNGSVAGSCNFLGGSIDNCAVEVGSRCDQNLRNGEHKTQPAGYNRVKARHTNGKVKHCYTSQNGKRTDDAAEEHLGEQKLGSFYGEGFCLECRFAVSCNVGRTEGVGQNTEYQNNQQSQGEFKSAAECVKDQGLKQRVAAVDHKGHCKRNGKVGEKIFGFTVNRNEFFSEQACGNAALEAEAELRTALSRIAVSVKNKAVKRTGDNESNKQCCRGKACGNEEGSASADAKQQRCECVCGISVSLGTHQNVYKFAGEQELDGAGFKQSAQNAENARVNEEGAYNENGQRYKGQEVSGAQELDDDHVGQDQDGSKKE